MYSAFIVLRKDDSDIDVVPFISSQESVHFVGISALLMTSLACFLAIFPSGSITEDSSYTTGIRRG